MKKLLILMILSTNIFGSDLIYKQGFEPTALVSGTASGVVSTGLTLNLNVNGENELLMINENGIFTFYLAAAIGSSYNTEIFALPSSPQQQNCSLSNSNGTIPSSGVNSLIISCNNTEWNWDEMNWSTGGWN